MKSTVEINELKALDQSALAEKLSDSEEELMKLRFKHSSAQLDQTSRLKLIRRRIARIKARQNELRREDHKSAAEA